MHNILVSAYGCEPFVGSEAGVGWNWVLQMAKNNYLHVITRSNNKEKIELNIPHELRENIIFYYYDASKFVRKLKKREKGLYLYYTFWQIGIIKIIRQILSKNKIDYTMHLSFGSFWMPTFLPFFKIPFIWGPLGGGDCVPKPFLRELPIKDRIIQSLRYFLKDSSFVNPLVAFPSKKAKVILARTEDSAETIPKKYRYKVRVILETAMSDDIFDIKKIDDKSNRLELIYTGRLVPIKNVISIVKAINIVPESYCIHLTVVGRGPEKQRIESFIKSNRLENRVTMINEIPRADVLQLLAASDVYLFPSLHEGGSWALMEAMAIGLPIICLDCTGMHTITSEESAVRIKPVGEADFEKKTADAIMKFYDDQIYRMGMGQAARDRILNCFRWTDKGEYMEKLFAEMDSNEIG